MRGLPWLSFFAVLVSVVFHLAKPPVPHRAAPVAVGQTYCTTGTACVLTYHNDNNRDGANANESVLQASTLGSSAIPAPQWMGITDGQIFAQPLYVHQLALNGTPTNVVYTATQNNSLYAWDADSANPAGTVLASINLNDATDLGAGSTEIAVPYSDLPFCGSPNIQPEIGITGTPVIDVSVTPPVIYLVSKHEDIDSLGNKTYRHKLHALAADTLQELPGSPLILDSTFASSVPGYSAQYNLQRAALTLVSGGDGTSKVWVAWASHCDGGAHYGYAIEFTYSYSGTPGFLSTYSFFNTESACLKMPCTGGIWMSGGAPASDSQGNIYFAVGNGADKTQGTGEYSNSVVRLSDTGLQDYYSPPNYHALNAGKAVVACTNPNPPRCGSPCALDSTGQYCQLTLTQGDLDLGSGGVVLLAPTFALSNPEMVAAGKQGMIYVVYSNNMGHIDSQAANFAQYACATATAPAPGSIAQCWLGMPSPNTGNHGSHGTPAFLSGSAGKAQYNYLYYVGAGDVLRAFRFQNSNSLGLFNPGASTASSPHRFQYPGASPSLTWNGGQSGGVTGAVVWALDTSGFGILSKPAGPAVLYAYKAVPSGGGPGSLGAQLWDSSAYNTSVPGNPGAVKFMIPTVADGKIFVAGGAQGYQPTSANCPTPSASTQPTACGAITMYK